MLKLKLQYFGHLMRRVDSLEKTLMLGGIGGRRRSETIVTHGRGIRQQVIGEIRRAAETVGVIVFTDPDTPGEALRRIIDAAVPGCKHAYIPKEKARTTRKVGVEHAGYEDLKEALDHVSTECGTAAEVFSPQTMLELGLLGDRDSSQRRKKLAEALHISYGSAAKKIGRAHV